MRFRLLCLMWLAWLPAVALPAASPDFRQAFELAGIRLLCEQSAPLLVQGLQGQAPAELESLFAAEPLCSQLAERVARSVTAEQLQQAVALLDSPLARRFSAAEAQIGAENEDGLAAYRAQLLSRPPRAERLGLVAQLDTAAHTTALATLLRYEVGKTQAWLALRARGAKLDEQALGELTAHQQQVLQQSTAAAVQSFMLYAYRQIPSDELQAYAELYRQPSLKALLEACVAALPALFAERRAQLR